MDLQTMLMLGGTRNFLTEAIMWIQDFSNDMTTGMASAVLRFNSIDGQIMSAILTYITGPIGFAMMVIFFVKAMIGNVTDGKDIIVEDIAKPLFFLVVTDLILTNMGPIINSFIGLSNFMGTVYDTYIDSITIDPATLKAGVVESAGAHAAEVDSFLQTEESLNKVSIVGLIILLVQSIGSFLVSILAAIFLFVVLFSAKLELMMRFSFAPIGFAQLADETQKHEAFRYLKKLFASAFYYVAILVVLFIAMNEAKAIGQALVAGEAKEGNIIVKGLLALESALFGAAAPFAAVGAVSIAKNIVNEAFGA